MATEFHSYRLPMAANCVLFQGTNVPRYNSLPYLYHNLCLYVRVGPTPTNSHIFLKPSPSFLFTSRKGEEPSVMFEIFLQFYVTISTFMTVLLLNFEQNEKITMDLGCSKNIALSPPLNTIRGGRRLHILKLYLNLKFEVKNNFFFSFHLHNI